MITSLYNTLDLDVFGLGMPHFYWAKGPILNVLSATLNIKLSSCGLNCLPWIPMSFGFLLLDFEDFFTFGDIGINELSLEALGTEALGIYYPKKVVCCEMCIFEYFFIL